jgi:hypothetical protein
MFSLRDHIKVNEMTPIGCGRYGFSKKGFKESPDRKVSPNFSK